EYAQRAEPIRLVVSGGNAEVQKRAFLVPHAAVIAGHYAKPVIARRKVRVLHSALVDDHSPVLVLAFQHEAEMHVLRSDKAECGVIDRKVVKSRRQLQSSLTGYRQVVGFAVCRDLLNVYRRRKCVRGKMPGIDDANPIERQEPQSSIGRPGDARAIVVNARVAPYAVR